MPKYTVEVIVTRTQIHTLTTEFEVEAVNEDDAQALAETKAEKYVSTSGRMEWELDDNDYEFNTSILEEEEPEDDEDEEEDKDE